MLKVLQDKWTVRQKGIILALYRVVLCLAGAGAGKTTVLAERVAYFIRRGIVAAGNVYLTTFSRRAAAMLNGRIRQAAGVDVHASTIHSLALEVILSATASNGCSEPEILDQRAQCRIIEQALENHPARNTLTPERAVARISWWKAHGFRASEIQRLYPADPQADAFGLYEKLKGSALDFCDLITRATALLESDASVRDLWHDRVKYLAIDELQDTNPLELRFLTRVASPSAFIFAVGDPDQSIYQFQGADITNCLHFDRYFPGAEVLLLTENRRSTSTILACAQRLIQQNTGRYPKVLTPVRPSGAPVSIVDALDSQEEQEYVAAQIQIALKEGIPLGEIAVLARTRQLVASYSAFLKGRGWDVSQHRYDEDFWSKPTVTHAVAVVAAVAGTGTTKEWNALMAHFPQADRLAILRQAEIKKCEIQNLADSGVLAQLMLTAPGYEYVSKLLDALGQLRQQPLDDVGRSIAKNSHALGFLEGKGAAAAKSVARDLDSFANAVADLSRQPNISDFKALHNRFESTPVTAHKISVLTAHTVKGLEFGWVFVVGCEEGLFPHFYATDTNVEDMQEERRLFFVVMTRAKDRLFLLHARKRWSGGANHKKYPSRFISEIGAAETEQIDATAFLKGMSLCTSHSINTAQ
ncbi:MAG: ATP-dependent helicase [Planctomycetota bacterium]